MYGKLTRFVDQHMGLVGGVGFLVVFGLWALSEFVPSVRTFLVQSSFFNVLILVLLFEVLRRVVELKLEGRSIGVRVDLNQDEAWPELQRYIQARRPKNIDMIEYSGGTVIAMLEELCRANDAARLRLLLCHPEQARSKFERNRIRSNMDYLVGKLSTTSRLEIRCYRVPASIRGRCFDGDFLNIGWYTYHNRRGGEEEIQGHVNAMVTTSTSCAEGKKLLATFSQGFDDLWNHPKTVALSSRDAEALGVQDRVP